VWRKVGMDDFKHSGGLANGSERAGLWWVCDEGYEIQGDAIVARRPAPGFVRENSGSWRVEADRNAWRSYKLLEEVPDLFLKFTRQHGADNPETAALDWSRRYGVIGDRMAGLIRPDRMSLSCFREEAKRAWVVLKMYEAALNRDEGAVRCLLDEHKDDEVLEQWPYYDPRESSAQEDALLQLALFGSVYVVEQTVQETCRPALIVTDRHDKANPAAIESTWDFHNLLGAMYLQMYWLMSSGGDITRCEYCGGIISLTRPRPEGRKTRRDKKFCDDACRQAHHRSKRNS
jgi:hypothetical protein